MINTQSIRRVSRVLLLMLTLIALLSVNSVVFASGLNGVDSKDETTTQTTMQNNTNTSTPNTTGTVDQDTIDQQNTANAIGDMFGEAGVDEESIKTAQEFLRPFAKIMNNIMAGILGITSLLMMGISVLDLLYMAFPPVRDILDGGMHGQQQMGRGRGSRGMGGMRGMRGMGGMGMGGMGMGGMQGGMGMGGMGMGGMDGGMGGGMGMQQQQQPVGGGLSALGRWVSDEAIAACMESSGGPMAGMQGGAPMPFKSMMLSYAKKRALFLIIFGVCVILFTSTVFTDLGIKLGMWILQTISGF